MTSKKEDKKCPKCGNTNEDRIFESFIHGDECFYYEYQCMICDCSWRRVFEYVGLQVLKDDKWYA